jgi:hypothetical protein
VPNYTEFHVGNRGIAGMMPMDASTPAAIPNHWLVYFAVDDCDAAAERVGDLGGEVTMQPMDVPPGRFALVKDPQGAMFGIIARHPAAA